MLHKKQKKLWWSEDKLQQEVKSKKGVDRLLCKMQTRENMKWLIQDSATEQD